MQAVYRTQTQRRACSEVSPGVKAPGTANKMPFLPCKRFYLSTQKQRHGRDDAIRLSPDAGHQAMKRHLEDIEQLDFGLIVILEESDLRQLVTDLHVIRSESSRAASQRQDVKRET